MNIILNHSHGRDLKNGNVYEMMDMYIIIN
jgi:hypothetical protein